MLVFARGGGHAGRRAHRRILQPRALSGHQRRGHRQARAAGGLVATATYAARRAGSSPRWLQWVAVAVVALLPLGGAAFLLDNAVLTAALYASLPLLLLWTGATAYVVGLCAR